MKTLCDTEAEVFPAGKTIFAEGELGEVMYAVVEGDVAIIFGDKVINTHGPGEIFGEMALIDTKRRSATAVAKSDCKLVPIDEKRFFFLVQQHPYFPLQLLRVLSERLRLRTES